VPPHFGVVCRERSTNHKLLIANDIPHRDERAWMSPSKKLLTLITPPCYSAASLLTKPASNPTELASPSHGKGRVCSK
jgi:hypothetical protein